MEKLLITLEITDQETVESYKDVHQDLILEDIVNGTLGEKCDMVRTMIVKGIPQEEGE